MLTSMRGCRCAMTAALSASAVMVFSGTAGGQCEIGKFHGSDTNTTDQFGHSIAVDGEFAIVGAWIDEQAGDDAGSAYIFLVNADGSLTELEKIIGSDVGVDDHFGVDVDIDDETVVVGASQWSPPDGGAGAAYVFDRGPVAPFDWVQVAKLTPPAGQTEGEFGRAVAIEGDVVLIGDLVAGGFASTGKVFVHERHAGGVNMWGRTATLEPSDPATRSFGSSVDLSGDYAVVGAYQTTDGAPGGAFVFRRNVDGSWTELVKLTGSGSGPADLCGRRVSIDGDVIAFGCEQNSADAGMVYVFERSDVPSGSAWTETAMLMAPPEDHVWNMNFGVDVAVDGNMLLVGASRAGVNNNGAAYVFRQAGPSGAWVMRGTMVPSDSYIGQLFGGSVALENDLSLIGVRADDDLGTVAGAAYAFSIDALDCNANGMCDDDEIAADPSLDGNDNGVLDECEGITDLNGDGFVNVLDLLELLGNWDTDGPGAAIAPDVNVVNVHDLLGMLSDWGPTN